MSPNPSQYFGGSQDEAFERSLLEIPFPMDEQPSPSPSPPPAPSPPPQDDVPPSSPEPDETVQLEPLRRPQQASLSPEPDETIQLLAKGEKDSTATAESSRQGGGAAPSASPSAWSGLKRPPTAAEIEEGKRKLAFGASTFGGGGDYMRNKRLKLQFQNQERAQAGSNPQIFKAVSIYINGYTQPSPPELRDMFLAHGGTFHAYLDKKSLVTHIIASQLTPQKIKEFEKYKVVTAQWIVQSIEAGKLLPWGQFKWKPTVAPGASQIPSQREFSFGSSTPIAQASSSSDRRRDASSSSGLKDKGKGRETAWDVEDDEEDDGTPGFVERESKRRKTSEGEAEEEEEEWRDEDDEDEDVDARMETGDDSDGAILTTSTEITKTSINISRTFNTSTRPSPFLVPALPPSALKNRSLAPDPDAAPPPPDLKKPDRPSYALHPENQAASKFMEQEDWRKAHTSASGSFIKSYFEHSRLHWLSTWKAELINLVSAAQTTVEQVIASTKSNPSSQTNSLSSAVLPKITSPSKSAKKKEKVIMHCDFDAFFVSVGRLGREDLVGKPVVVCHSSGKGAGAASTSEVASPSYEAREFGVKAGMSLGQARQLCPNILSIPYDFEKYKSVALKFYTILISYADVLQAVSVDEALLEVTTQVRAHRPDEDDEELDRAKEVAELIRNDVRAATGCEISIGIASNVLLARLASRKAKPAGSYHLKQSEVLSFLAPLKVRDLWGFGREKSEKIERIFKTSIVGELRKRRVGELQAALGEATGKQLYDACRGIDSRVLQSSQTRKSVSAEVNYGIRFKTSDEAENFVLNLAAEAAKRLRQAGMLGRALTLGIKTRAEGAPVEAPKFMGHGHCDDSSSTKAILGPGGTATDDPAILGRVAVQLLRDARNEASELRGIGIMITKLEEPRGKGASKPLEAGQGTLSFAKKPNPPKLVDTKNAVASSSKLPGLVPAPVAPGPSVVAAPPAPIPPSAPPPPLSQPSVPAQPTIIPSTPIQARPSLSQVDPEALAALPASLRKELYPDWDGRDHRSASPTRRGRSADAIAAPASAAALEAVPSRLAAAESPKGKKASADVARMVRQLAPKSKVQVSPQRAKSFFAAPPPNAPHSPPNGNAVPGPSKPSNKLPARVGSDQEVVELAALLEYDLEFLLELPANVLRDQLSSMRAERDKLLAKKGKLKPLQPKVDAMLRGGYEQGAGGGRTTRRSVSAGQEENEAEDRSQFGGDGDENGSARGSSRHEDDSDDADREEEERGRMEERHRVQLQTQRHQQQQDEDARRLHRRRQLEASGPTIVHLQLGPSPNAPRLPHLLVHPSFPVPNNDPPTAHTYPLAPILGSSKSQTKSSKRTQVQTLDDLRTFLDKWIHRDSSAEPRAAGTKMMGDFVIECFRVKGAGNKEKGMGLMKWWRMRIRQKFGERRRVEEDWDVEMGEEEEEGDAGRRWWHAWEEVWERVGKEVEGAREKYGGVWECD